MTSFKHTLLALAIGSTAVLTGCGSDSDDNNDNSGRDNLTLSSCPTESFVTAQVQSEGKDVCQLFGTIGTDFELTADKTWLLAGTVKVDGTSKGNADKTLSADKVQDVKDSRATLTIEEGTDVRGLANSVLVVTRGGLIDAEGTAENPITFSSAQDNDYDGEAEWGGVVVQGFGIQHGPSGTCVADNTCNVQGEGGSGIGFFGGTDNADNSGVIKYVRIAEGGIAAGQGNEINGLTLQGVGSGTTLEYIQVHSNRDDGIEWFGGAANLKYAVLTSNDDDDIDFDEGYVGNMQYVLIIKNQTKEAPSGSNDPRGVEANSSGDDAVSATTAALANFTVVGGQVSSGQTGLKLRGQVNVEFANTVVTNWLKECAEYDDVVVDLTQVESDCSAAQIDDKGNSTITGAIVNDLAISLDQNWAYTSNSTVNAAAPTVVGDSNFAFDETSFIGAVDPNAATPFWDGWVLEGTVPASVVPAVAQ